MTPPADEGRRIIASRYELHEELGRGGMGVVWRAHDHSLDREVAIKEVRVPEYLDPEDRDKAHARILREAQTAARIPHPSVITVHDILDAEDRPWIVMERVHGQTLQQHLDTEGPLPADRARIVAEAMLGALAAAHGAGVVHRDVKPGNILLADDGRVILTDFGIATVDGATALTRTGTMIGSPEYMSPERLEHDQVTPLCDLWSLGAVLHACAEGRSPFQRETVTATITAVVALPIPEPSHAGPLAPIIGGLLERDTQRRLTAEGAHSLLTGGAPTETVRPAPPTRQFTTTAPHPSPPPPQAAPPRPSWQPSPRPDPMRPYNFSAPSAHPASQPHPAPSGEGGELPGPLHALRAILLLTAGVRAFSWYESLGEELTYHAAAWLPMPMLHLTLALAALVLALVLPLGRTSVFLAVITLQVLVLLLFLLDLGAGYPLHSGILFSIFALVFVLTERSRAYLLHR